MASVKSTFTLDTESARRLAQTSEQLGRPKSEIVREAILDYSERVDHLGERERLRLLATFDELVAKIPERAPGEAEAERTEVREARRGGGRRSDPAGG